MPKFNVSYEVINADGNVEEAGMWSEGVSLREALEAAKDTRTSACDGVECVEASSSDVASARWVTVYNGQEFETGCRESRSLHFPENLSTASRARIARLLGARVA